MATKNTTCRYCGSAQFVKFLSLGEQPPSNSFIRADQVSSEKRYPLDVYLCMGCGLVQLLDVVPAEVIFDDYVYRSSTSKALKNHYAKLTKSISTRFGLKGGDVVADIGCNDGILLNAYTHPGLTRVGVEPSSVASVAGAFGHKIYKKFFSPDVSRQIVGDHGKARVVTATNVFAHVDNISSFTDGLAPLLADDGVLVIEASYLVDLIDQTLFDTIYHEHLCYIALTPVLPFLLKHGLEVFDVERVPIGASGPAIRIYAGGIATRRPVEKSVRDLLDFEESWGVRRLARYEGYARQVQGIKEKILRILQDLKASGSRIGGYGAPAKGNTLLNYLGIKSDLVEQIAETSEIKQGLVTPGSHIPIVSEDQFLAWMPEYALLLSWNYLDFFLKKSDYIKKGGRFVVPVPEPRIAP